MASLLISAALLLIVLIDIQVAATNPRLIAPKKYFGYYSAILSETAAYSSIYQADTLADAVQASAKGLPSLLLVYDAFFTTAPKRKVLYPDWPARWQSLAAQAAPFLQNGTLLGFNLGDELVWNCLAPANLTIVANAVRASFPLGTAIIWYNEATRPLSTSPQDRCGHTVPDYSVPTALDWFSTDIYHMNGPVVGWTAAWVQPFYEQRIFPRLAAHQRVVLVPGAFGSDVNHFPNGTYVCNRSCYDTMCALDAEDFAAWARQDARVVGVFPWNYAGCPACNGSRWTPPDTCCMDELGARVQPVTRAAWQRLGPTLGWTGGPPDRVVL